MTASATDSLVTERLILRRPKDADLEPFALLCADPQVMRWIGSGRPLDRGAAERSFAIIQAHWSAHGSGLRSAISRDDGEYLGFVGLAVVPARSVGGGETEIGWRLRRAAWGRGYATEGALAVRDHALCELGLPTLISLIQPPNAQSVRVAEKLGMRADGHGRGAHGERVVVYRVFTGVQEAGDRGRSPRRRLAPRPQRAEARSCAQPSSPPTDSRPRSASSTTRRRPRPSRPSSRSSRRD